MPKILYEKDWINDEWFTDSYQEEKLKNFELVDQYLGRAPLRILDIGCGLAWESRLFNKKYGSELYLLDGDYDDNPKDRLLVQGRYNNDVQDFAFYHRLDFLQKTLDELGTTNYQLIDCNNIDLDSNIKFDLITSWVSCGFHYPVNAYRDLILKHSDQNTRIIMDLRLIDKSAGPLPEENVTVINTIIRRRKYHTVELKIS